MAKTGRRDERRFPSAFTHNSDIAKYGFGRSLLLLSALNFLGIVPFGGGVLVVFVR